MTDQQEPKIRAVGLTDGAVTIVFADGTRGKYSATDLRNLASQAGRLQGFENSPE
jgi:hypothetical protein